MQKKKKKKVVDKLSHFLCEEETTVRYEIKVSMHLLMLHRGTMIDFHNSLFLSPKQCEELNGF